MRVAGQTTDLKYSSLLLDSAYFDQFRPHISSPALTDIISSKSGGLRIYHLGPSRGADLDDLLEALAESGAEVVLIERQAPQNLIEALESAGYTVARLDTLMTHAADGDREAYERAMLENAEVIAAAFKES